MDDRPERKHMSSFKDCTNLISNAWNNIPDRQRSVFKEHAQIQFKRYHNEQQEQEQVDICEFIDLFFVYYLTLFCSFSPYSSYVKSFY